MADIDIAVKLLRMTIFQEKEEPEVKLDAKMEESDEEKANDPLPVSARAQRTKLRNN